jgi:mRNA deadenylase 3'-5' endonuclease subunit Ccr4
MAAVHERIIDIDIAVPWGGAAWGSRYFWGCLDYIWYHAGMGSPPGLIEEATPPLLKVHSVLKVPTRSDFRALKMRGCPHLGYPSDHLSLRATFLLRPASNTC